MSSLAVSRRRIPEVKWSNFAPFLFKQDPVLSLERANKLLKICADTCNLRAGESIHTQLIMRNQASKSGDVFQINSLINLYVKCGKMVPARKLFDLMPERNVVSWSSIMAGYLHSRFELEVLKLFRFMVFKGQPMPNEYAATIFFGSCSNTGKVEEGKQCHAYVLKSGFLFHKYVCNALIYMYSTCSCIEEAIQVLDDFSDYDILACNSALSGLLEHGFVKEGLDVLRRIIRENLSWDSFTFTSALRLCASLKDSKLGLQIHGRVLVVGIESDAVTNGAIINMYGKCGKIAYALKAFDDSETQNVILWTSVMDAYFQNDCFEEALNLFTQMEVKDVQPNEFTFAILLNSTAELSLLRHGDLLHGCVLKLGFRNHVMVATALVNMYSKSGSIGGAEKVFLNMTYRDIITWNTMICGYSHHGLGNEALEVFSQMMFEGESPNYVTFIGVLCACSHLGLVQEGFYYFNQLMKRFGIQPGLEHHTCIIGLLSKAKMFDEAASFMRTVPIEWDVVAWRTLLNACYVHRNYCLGKQVAEFVIGMDPNDVGTYILLSNMHAKSKEWDEVAKIRSLMSKRRTKKEPGVSWIEIQNTTHVFVSEDSKHPEIMQIYRKVKEILAKIRSLGYLPDVSGVCHDVEEEQKEDYLCYHSEKLAVAYGLMKTPEKSPIHIFKNLRICDDCHSAMKLISRVSNRDIIIRDANRFHHFISGQCSCCDYW